MGKFILPSAIIAINGINNPNDKVSKKPLKDNKATIYLASFFSLNGKISYIIFTSLK